MSMDLLPRREIGEIKAMKGIGVYVRLPDAVSRAHHKGFEYFFVVGVEFGVFI